MILESEVNNMREFKASTKRGQYLINQSNYCVYRRLSDIYKTWSQAKQNAYEWCLNQYLESENHSAFGIGNANTFGFTASWLCTINGENAMRIETKDNSYIVWLDR